MEVSKGPDKQNCAIHGEYDDYLRLFGKVGGERKSICPACMIRQNKVENQRESLELSRRVARRHAEGALRRSGIPKRFLNRTFDTYEAATEGQSRALAIAEDYAENFDQRLASGTSLIFCGTTGTGKTHLACAIGNRIMAEGFSALFCTAREIMSEVKNTWSKRSNVTEKQVIESVLKTDLLILDEVGVQFDSDAERLIMFDLINGRYQDVKPTLILSNLPFDAAEGGSIKGVLGDRVVDRLRESKGKLVKFDWESYRGQQ